MLLVRVNCLNKKESLPILKGDQIIGYEKFVFWKHRLPNVEIPVFKIPETCETQVFTVQVSTDPEEDFKSCVNKYKVKGITFRLVWSDDAS